MTKKRGISRRFTYALSRWGVGFFDIVVSAFPLSVLYPLCDLLGWLGYVLAFQQRRVAFENLARAFGRERSGREIGQIARRCFNAMATSAVEFFMFMRRPQLLRKYVEVVGWSNLDKALAKGRGVVIVSAHFGNFPVLLSRLALQGYKVHAMLRHMRDPGLDDLFERKRLHVGVGSVYTQPREACVRHSLEVLRDNEILFVQLDQNFGTGGVFVDFFGTKAATATGPVVLSLRTQAALVPVFIYRLRGPRHRVVIKPALEAGAGETKESRVLHLVQELTTLIEGYVRRYPHEWSWIHKRWKAQPKVKN